jgi:hypothetical protein
MVHLIEVDVVGLQSPQTLFAGALDMVGRQAALIPPVTHRAEDLGRQDDPVAPPTLCQPAPNDFLCQTQVQIGGITAGSEDAIDVGCVEKGDALVESLASPSRFTCTGSR